MLPTHGQLERATSVSWPQLCAVFFLDYSVEESYQPRDYLAATMQFMPGHFACDVVWSTLIHVHSRLKMGPNMGVSRGVYSPGSFSFCVKSLASGRIGTAEEDVWDS